MSIQIQYRQSELMISGLTEHYENIYLREVLYKDELNHLPLQVPSVYNPETDTYHFDLSKYADFFESYREYNILGKTADKAAVIMVSKEFVRRPVTGLSAGLQLLIERENGGLQHYSKRGAVKLIVQPDPQSLARFSRFDENEIIVVRKPKNWQGHMHLVGRVLLDRDATAAYKDNLILPITRETQTHLFVSLKPVLSLLIQYRETNYIEIMLVDNQIVVPIRSDKRHTQAVGNWRYITLKHKERLLIAAKPATAFYPVVESISTDEETIQIQLSGEFSQHDTAVLQQTGRSLYQNALAGQHQKAVGFSKGVVTLQAHDIFAQRAISYVLQITQVDASGQGLSTPVLLKKLEQYDALSGRMAQGAWRIQKRSNRLVLLSQPESLPTKPVKLAVLGSCYSRRGLASSEYFSPEYKQYFQVVQTQFHTSFPSLVAEPATRGLEKMQDLSLNPKHRHWIETDLSKTFFEQLAKTQPEYLVFDLYADSHVGMIDWGDGQLSMAYYFYKQQLKSLLYELDDVTIISHQNVDQYMATWEKAAQEFFKRLLRIVPEDHIIMQKAHRTYSYWDAEHKEVKIDELFYGQAESEGRRGDYFAERMEAWIMAHYPNIHVIDLDSYNLRGQYNHPDGPTTNHYEPAWYKAYVAELGKTIMLQERLDRN